MSLNSKCVGFLCVEVKLEVEECALWQNVWQTNEELSVVVIATHLAFSVSRTCSSFNANFETISDCRLFSKKHLWILNVVVLQNERAHVVSSKVTVRNDIV